MSDHIHDIVERITKDSGWLDRLWKAYNANQPRDDKGRWTDAEEQPSNPRKPVASQTDIIKHKDPNHRNPYIPHDYHANDAAKPSAPANPQKGPLPSLQLLPGRGVNLGYAPERPSIHGPKKPAPSPDFKIKPLKVGVKWGK